MGSYETWAAWCRDPLFTLGCPDPIPRLHQEKDRDPERGAIKDVLRPWWRHHHSRNPPECIGIMMTLEDLRPALRSPASTRLGQGAERV